MVVSKNSKNYLFFSLNQWDSSIDSFLQTPYFDYNFVQFFTYASFLKNIGMPLISVCESFSFDAVTNQRKNSFQKYYLLTLLNRKVVDLKDADNHDVKTFFYEVRALLTPNIDTTFDPPYISGRIKIILLLNNGDSTTTESVEFSLVTNEPCTSDDQILVDPTVFFIRGKSEDLNFSQFLNKVTVFAQVGLVTKSGS